MAANEADAARIEALRAEATPESAGQLRDLAETTTNKETRKEARRALFLLSQQGIHPAERAEEPVSPAPETQADNTRAYATAFDGAGNRLLFFVLPDRDGGSPQVARILVNEETGVRDYQARRMPRRELTTFLMQYESSLSNGLAFAEIESDYARWLLAQAREINRQRSTTTPTGFLDVLAKIGPPREEYSQSPVYTHIRAFDVRTDESVPREPVEFFRLPWFEPWFFAVEEILPWFARMVQADQSPMELPDIVRQERRMALLKETCEGLLPPERRAAHIRRLEESADVLRRRGEDRAARIALYHALELAEDKPVGESDFAQALVLRTVVAAYEMMREENQPPREQDPDTH